MANLKTDEPSAEAGAPGRQGDRAELAAGAHAESMFQSGRKTLDLTSFHWKRATLAFLRWVPEVLVFVSLLVLVTRFRLLHLEPVEVGGDALKVWEYARTAVLGGDLPEKLNHHTSRFGLVFPSMLAQTLAGSQATSYYLGPLAASVLTHLFVYLTVRRLGGMLAGVLTVLAMLEFAPFGRSSSQILPEAFGPMYSMGAYLCAVYFTDLHRKWSQALCLALASLFLFFAYGSKMNYLMFAPGLALIVWLGKHRVAVRRPACSSGDVPKSRWSRLYLFASERHLLVPAALTLLVCLLLALEFVVFRSSGENGRFAVLSNSHGAGGLKGPRINEFADFFSLYARAPHVWTPLLIGTVFAVGGLFAFARDRRSKLFALGLTLFFLFQTFSVRHFDPLIAWMEPHPRYLLAIAPFSFVMVGLFAHAVFSNMWSQLGLWTRTGVQTRSFLLAVASFSFVFFAWNALDEEWDRTFEKSSGWAKTERLSATLSKHFSSGMPIVSRSKDGKPAWAAGAVWIDPKLLVRDKKIRSHRDFFRGLKPRGKYLARDVRGRGGTKLGPLVARRTKLKQCVVLLDQRGRFTRVKTRIKKDCLSLTKELETFPERIRWKTKPAKQTQRKERAKRRR